MRKLGETGVSDGDNAVEGRRILGMLDEGAQNKMTPWELKFVADMADQLADLEPVLTPAQLFKLRDIKDKCL